MNWVRVSGDKGFERQVKRLAKEGWKYYESLSTGVIPDAEDIAGYVMDQLMEQLPAFKTVPEYDEFFNRIYTIVTGGEDLEGEEAPAGGGSNMNIEDNKYVGRNDEKVKQADIPGKKYKIVVNVKLAYVVEAPNEAIAKQTMENIELPKYYVEDSLQFEEIVEATQRDENLYSVTEFI